MVECDVADDRCDVLVEHPLVATSCRVGEERLGVDPDCCHELTEGSGSAARWPGLIDSGLDGFGCGAVGAGWMPASPFGAGEWVAALVVDDVEILFALHDV